MQTLRAFLAMAALAPLARPLERVASSSGRPCRALADCLPHAGMLARPGRDIHFLPGLVQGRLVVVDLLYARRDGILGMDGAMHVSGAADPDLFLYALTEGPAPALPCALTCALPRAMHRYANARVGAFAVDDAGEVDVLRARLVLLQGPRLGAGEGRHEVPGNEKSRPKAAFDD